MDVVRISIKALVICCVFITIIIIIVLISGNMERENCSRTIEQGLKTSTTQIIEHLINAERNIQHHEPFKAFILIQNARQISETLKQLYPEEFIKLSLQKDQTFALKNQSSLSKIQTLLSLPDHQKFPIWEILNSGIQCLEQRSRTEAQKQVLSISSSFQQHQLKQKRRSRSIPQISFTKNQFQNETGNDAISFTVLEES
jgi:hypothetical protein